MRDLARGLAREVATGMPGAQGLVSALTGLFELLGSSGEQAPGSDRSGVDDTLEQLQQHIEVLIRRLGQEQTGEVGDAASAGTAPVAVESSPQLDSQIESLGRKVDSAADLLAELTDILEQQTERIETIEHQLGDPDAFDEETEAGAAVPAGVAKFPAQPVAELEASIERMLDVRMERIERRIAEIEGRISETRNLAHERDRQVRDLEDRLLIMVDSAVMPVAERAPAEPFSSGPTPESVPEPVLAPDSYVPARQISESHVPVPPLEAEQPAYEKDASSPAAEPVAASEPAIEPGAGGDGGDGPARARLAELVEREVRQARDFEGGAQAGSRGGKAHPTVLVVDDAADARTIISIYLSKTGYQVVTATSAEDALAKLRHHDVDALVVDGRMPGADGGHLCRMVREDAAYAAKRELPIIVYTAYPDELDEQRAMTWGANEYIIKGGDMLPLISALVRHTGDDVRATS